MVTYSHLNLDVRQQYFSVLWRLPALSHLDRLPDCLHEKYPTFSALVSHIGLPHSGHAEASSYARANI